ncbi:hypothetical protein G4G27_05275 [Sphingomonas sp. So64.6b]|uniref:Uncharacterized protein n=1 Tax=Sphingomonas alpina TaxID=653931 RepID=A0A7G5YYF2_9SPHN|nr:MULTISPECIES: hypothetical protein [Sphingomonas]QNA83480.1 hypothetical protein G4G27_05275 [Sphingomonas sp. So64.6b]QNQ10704.1 hypothetical protein H3Z74_05770 [Sphingomonas alpina]
MKAVDSKTLQNQLESLDKAIVNGVPKEGITVARKTPFEPWDAVFGGRGAG